MPEVAREEIILCNISLVSLQVVQLDRLKTGSSFGLDWQFVEENNNDLFDVCCCYFDELNK
jgi:hypothetical protein